MPPASTRRKLIAEFSAKRRATNGAGRPRPTHDEVVLRLHRRHKLLLVDTDPRREVIRVLYESGVSTMRNHQCF